MAAGITYTPGPIWFFIKLLKITSEIEPISTLSESFKSGPTYNSEFMLYSWMNIDDDESVLSGRFADIFRNMNVFVDPFHNLLCLSHGIYEHGTWQILNFTSNSGSFSEHHHQLFVQHLNERAYKLIRVMSTIANDDWWRIKWWF